MAIESRPFGGVTLTGEDARKFLEQIGELPKQPDPELKRRGLTEVDLERAEDRKRGKYD